MILFSSEKEIIFKLVNAVLLIWFIAAIAVAVSSTIQLVIPDPSQNYTYTEYKAAYCNNFDKTGTTLTAAEQEQQCVSDFASYQVNNKNSDYWKKISLYTSIANVIIVGGVLFFINRKKEEK